MIPDQQSEDATVSNYRVEAASSRLRRAQWLKEKLESTNAAKIGLFTITILGTSMVMGDGTLTPAISGTDQVFQTHALICGFNCRLTVLAVLSAVSGIREKAPNLSQCIFFIQASISRNNLHCIVTL